MRALTLGQPFADCIVHGPKRIENRPWKCPDKLLGWIAVHAGKGDYPYDEAELKRLWPEMPPLKEMSRGKIIGVMNVVRCLKPEGIRSPWASGPWCWVIKEVRPLHKPIECRGYQKLWNVPEEHQKEIDRQMRTLDKVSSRGDP